MAEQVSSEGAWVRENLWVPYLSVWDPHSRLSEDTWLVVAERRHWSKVRREIRLEGSNHPVLLVAPYTALYGSRFAGAVKHPSLGDVVESERFVLWWEQAVLCRIRQREETT